MIDDTRAARKLAEKATAICRGSWWKPWKSARDAEIEQIDSLLSQLLQAVRDEERRERLSAANGARADTVVQVVARLRRYADQMVRSINKRGVGATNRQKLTVKIVRSLADEMERPEQRQSRVEIRPRPTDEEE